MSDMIYIWPIKFFYRLINLPNLQGYPHSSKFSLHVSITPLISQYCVLFLRGLFSPFFQQLFEHGDHMLQRSGTASAKKLKM